MEQDQLDRAKTLQDEEAANARRSAERRLADASSRFAQPMLEVVSERLSIDLAEQRIEGLVKDLALTEAERIEALLVAWDTAARSAIEDNQLTPEEDRRLCMLKLRFALTEDQLDARKSITDVARVKVLNAVAEGRLPGAVALQENFPIVMRKGEEPLWCFNPAALCEHQHGTNWAAEGGPQSSAMKFQMDVGLLLVTNKALQFVGPTRSLQIPLKKIAAVIAQSDNVRIARTLATAKMVSFDLPTGDGPFSERLIKDAVRAFS